MNKAKDSFIIAQITDLHIGFDGDGEICQNSQRFGKVVQELNAMVSKPDIVLLTGDLVENGENWAYTKLRAQLEDISCPVFYAIGNHDDRECFTNSFPEVEVNDGFVQYTIEDWPIRIIVLDTLKEGFHGGGFCEKRKAWLDRTLAQKPEQPTLIAMHHPPIDTGIAWMTAQEEAPWVQSFRDTIKKYDNVVHVIAGHIHRTIYQKIENTTISVCEAIAPEVKLELAPIDPNAPDDRTLIRSSDPGYNLHHWNGKILTTHSARASSANTLVKFDKKHSYIVHKTLGITE